ncbi:hypothetical protein PCLA_04r0230 [Pseudomonas citronellolis]|nr:hypothetical protein PCLA_04r0230 [Pseudomonas citronellolis]
MAHPFEASRFLGAPPRPLGRGGCLDHRNLHERCCRGRTLGTCRPLHQSSAAHDR